MKIFYLRLIFITSLIFTFCYLIPNNSFVSAKECYCAGHYCFAECSYCSPYPENQFSYIELSGQEGECTSGDICGYGNYGGMAGCEPNAWEIPITCSSCPGGFFDQDWTWNVDTYACLNYNICAGGGGGGGGGGCTVGPEVGLMSCEDATGGSMNGLWAKYTSTIDPPKLVAQGVYPWPTEGT